LVGFHLCQHFDQKRLAKPMAARAWVDKEPFYLGDVWFHLLIHHPSNGPTVKLSKKNGSFRAAAIMCPGSSEISIPAVCAGARFDPVPGLILILFAARSVSLKMSTTSRLNSIGVPIAEPGCAVQYGVENRLFFALILAGDAQNALRCGPAFAISVAVQVVRGILSWLVAPLSRHLTFTCARGNTSGGA
jgi:hypothetical protein